MKRRDEILSTIRRIPALPAAGLEVVRILQDPEFEMDEMSRVIEHDPGMTSNVLRLANSSLYGGSTTLSSIRQAIIRLGARRIGQLAIASAIAPLAQAPIKEYDLPANGLWAHSVAVATCLDRLTVKLDLPQQEHGFTSALLHDIGKIVLGTFAGVDAQPILAFALQESLPFDLAEAELLGIDHAEAGAILLETWNLPPVITEIVRWHHEPDRSPTQSLVLDLTHLADALCLTSGVGAGRDGLQYRLSSHVVGRLKITTSMIDAVLCDVTLRLSDFRSLFSGPVKRC